MFFFFKFLVVGYKRPFAVWSQKGGHKCPVHKRPGHKRLGHKRPGHKRPGQKHQFTDYTLYTCRA